MARRGESARDSQGGVVERNAARAVIRRDGLLLMLRSQAIGDYKFPGGGVEAGESLADALVREVREECGRDVVRVGDVALVIDERRPADEPGWVLAMRSTYIECDVGPVEHALALDDYERSLGLAPAWVASAEALRVNRSLLREGLGTPWLPREIEALESLG